MNQSILLKKSRLRDISTLENYRYELVQRKNVLNILWSSIFEYARNIPPYPVKDISSKYFKGIYNGKLYLFEYNDYGIVHSSYKIDCPLHEHSSVYEILIEDGNTLPLYVNTHFSDPRCANLYNARVKDPYGTDIPTNHEIVRRYHYVISRVQRLSKLIDIILSVLHKYLEITYYDAIYTRKNRILNISLSLNNRMYILHFDGSNGNWVFLPEFDNINVPSTPDISETFKHNRFRCSNDPFILL